MTRAFLLLLLSLPAWAATVTDDTLTGTICADGLVYVGGCPEGATNLTGAGYFVDGTNGSDSNNGLTPATAFATLGRAHTAISGLTGPNVYLRSGVSTTGKIFLPSGTELNKTILSCYYLDNGVPYECTRTHPKAIIQGTQNLACILAYTCTYSPLRYEAQVTVYQTSHIQIRYLHFQETDAYGIKVEGGNTTTNDALYIEISDVSSRDTGHQPIQLANRGVGYVTLKRFSFMYYNNCEAQYQAWRDTRFTTNPQAVNPGDGCTLAFGWPAGVSISWDNETYALIEDGEVYGGIGECYAIAGTRKAIIRNVRAYGCYSAGIYLDASGQNVIEGNIMTWHHGNVGRATGDWSWSGFGGQLSNSYEDRVPAGYVGTGNLFRNNIVLEAGACMTVGPESLGLTSTNRKTEGKVLFNTFLGCRDAMTSVYVNAANGAGQYIFDSNIIYGPGRPECTVNTGATYINNLFDRTPTNANCRGSSYRVLTPQFATTYNSLLGTTYFNQRDFDDVELAAGSPGRGLGTASRTTEYCIGANDFPAWLTSRMENPPVPDLDCWRKCACYDARGRVRSTTAPHVGALETP